MTQTNGHGDGGAGGQFHCLAKAQCLGAVDRYRSAAAGILAAVGQVISVDEEKRYRCAAGAAAEGVRHLGYNR
jgi:hypothetical protein